MFVSDFVHDTLEVLVCFFVQGVVEFGFDLPLLSCSIVVVIVKIRVSVWLEDGKVDVWHLWMVFIHMLATRINDSPLCIWLFIRLFCMCGTLQCLLRLLYQIIDLVHLAFVEGPLFLWPKFS